jgi:hypothetical protein
MIGEGDCGAIGGMKIGRGNRSSRRKPAPAPLCPPQFPLDHTRAAAVGNQRLTARAIIFLLLFIYHLINPKGGYRICHNKYKYNYK